MLSYGLMTTLVVACFGAIGCASVLPNIEKQPDFPRYFTQRTSRYTMQARLDGERLHGVNEDVSRYGDMFRGHSLGGTIDLHADGNRVDGFLGRERVDVKVSDIDGVLTIQGVVGDVRSRLELTPTRFAGAMAGCRYDLSKGVPSDEWYVGDILCRDRGGEVRTSRVAFPADLRSRPADEQAVLLTSFFAY